MSWAEEVEKDLNEVFYQDFATEHMVEGRRVVCIIDSDQNQPRAVEYDLAQADFSLRMRKKDAPSRKAAGAFLNLDGRELMITSWDEQDGEYVVGLSAAALA